MEVKYLHYRVIGLNESSSWISDDFEFREPKLYNLVTTVTCDDESRNIYTVPVGRCNQQTSVEDSKYQEKPKCVLIVPGESISNKEPRKIPEMKKMHLYIFTGAPTLFYQQGNHN